MDVQSIVTANKSLSSAYTRKPDQAQTPQGEVGLKNGKQLKLIQQSITSIEDQLKNTTSPEVRDELELSYSSKKIELENLRSQQSLKDVDDAQEVLKSYNNLLESNKGLESVIQLDPSRVNSLIQ